MNARNKRFASFLAAALLLLAAQRPSRAGSATWATSPTSGDWNTAANWTPQTVPDSTTDIATFGASSLTNVTDENMTINLDSAVFNSGAPGYVVTLDVSLLSLYGSGIVNNSGSVQSFLIPEDDYLHSDLFFYNSATAGGMTTFNTTGGMINFNDTSSAGSATFNLTDGMLQANMNFFDDSTAAKATINASALAVIEFFDGASGGNATFDLTTGAFVVFAGDSNADHAIGNCIGGIQSAGSEVEFQEFSSAGEGVFTTAGATASGEQGGLIAFEGSATADSASIIVGGALGTGLTATTLTFFDTTTAASANITANGGVNGSDGGAVIFTKKSNGGNVSITLAGNGELDISTHAVPGVTTGSLAGEGSVLLGANTLTIGSNNQSTTFSGVIQGAGGITKIGSGALTLTGTNAYTGNTIITGGVLVVSNARGSGTGTGALQVNAGTFGGKGVVSGAVTIGTGSGKGAILAPAAGTATSATLTTKRAVIFQSDGTYSCLLSGRAKKATSDLVAAKGVTINAGAQFVLTNQVTGKLRTGTSFTVISNTAKTPISGTFANLADGATISVNGTTFQASYEGGDGNDLTLTVQ